MHDSGVLTVQDDTCKVSIGLEAEVSPEANDKPGVNPVAASIHSKLAGDVDLCFQAKRSDASQSGCSSSNCHALLALSISTYG